MPGAGCEVQNNCITFRDLGYAFSCSHVSSIVASPSAVLPEGITLPTGDVVFEVTIVKVRWPSGRGTGPGAPGRRGGRLTGPAGRAGCVGRALDQLSVINLHGVMIKRYSGDPWQYRSVCQKILEDLRI